MTFLNCWIMQVINYYSTKGVVASLHAEKPPNEVTSEVKNVLASWKGPSLTRKLRYFFYGYPRKRKWHPFNFLFSYLRLLIQQVLFVWGYRFLLIILEIWNNPYNTNLDLGFEHNWLILSLFLLVQNWANWNWINIKWIIIQSFIFYIGKNGLGKKWIG